jgi:outer membrane immunogenic protein
VAGGEWAKMRGNFAILMAAVVAAWAIDARAQDVPPPETMDRWEGPYVGLTGGAGAASAAWLPLSEDIDISGVVLGGVAGYNFSAFGRTVVGIEADASWSGITGDRSIAGCLGECSAEIDWIGSLRGRLGVELPSSLIYLTGGFSAAGFDASPEGTNTIDGTQFGWALGAGAEFALSETVSAKAEYLHSDFISDGNVDLSDDKVRVGLNIRCPPDPRPPPLLCFFGR